MQETFHRWKEQRSSALPGDENRVAQTAPRNVTVIKIRSAIRNLYGRRWGRKVRILLLTGGLDLNQVSEQNQVIMSVLDNMQRILNCRAGTLAHIPDFGLPDMTTILQGLPGTAHQLMRVLSDVLLKYEPRLKRIEVVMQEQSIPGELRYAIDAELKGIGLVRYGTEFMPEGRVLIRHMRQQNYLDPHSHL
ncbi:MAG TPA: type VI secretion system baseplate subunit TssE [Scandinavium sp.]